MLLSTKAAKQGLISKLSLFTDLDLFNENSLC